MLIKVNGKEEEINEEITILQYLENKGVNPENIVIQYNGEIIDGEDVDEIILVANDNLEVLKFVGGG
ncbi:MULTISPECIES: sulfur carrier protein ThiS [unclassified Candidatus Frackibacter]|uniref:sulfur carrier protein ThiS n=1 Tax=unclassified Candidatus Frackibacter TaxID=2648818 RepID=UPI000797F54D|nr:MULTISPECIES: sulfur carrier protein ThiS [unclassified Candidatus Frackibacter]KXS45634.1 MAG: sulfur carrier protein [Candidatus Frackibacter sp. T328-2]SDC59378.1 sulfur carrier protein [Candidatus Frackibacter sp. WG11]SEM42382.1 sulfur carrier protein [Candidatus Frackibacter sp. WG12]SFL85236.1 sulfur carrier protein [Candidatus Frackibacter sp. WG13]